MAPPRIEIDEELLFDLASICCTNEEMALILKCSKDTLERRYAAVIREGRAAATMSLKRQLFKMASKEHFGALVWLTKNFCGMSDQIKQVTEVTTAPEIQSKMDEAVVAVNELVKSIKDFKEVPTSPSVTMTRLQQEAGVIN